MVAKVQEALRTQAAIVLMDAIGNPIHDSDGTKGSLFWRQNSRKIYAMEEDNFNGFISKNKRRRTSQQEKDELTEVHEKIEEVVLAAEGLPLVVAGLKELAGLKSALTRQQILAMKDAFSCAICKDR
ncbi:uncharacterized protein [Paramormyrops kingsleyae]|uniref:uncharacterized protein isoform X4 n=1 Tax=Paramormyrops kingsleyae TaxID=1676925 RepID=UPI003B97AE48